MPAKASRARPTAPGPSSPRAGRSTRGPWLAAIVLALAGLLAYASGLSAPFVWDDETAILTNPTIRQLVPLPGPLSPPPETPVSGRPLANVSLAVNYAIGEIDPRGYRAGNLVFVVLSAMLLAATVRRTLRSPGLVGRWGAAAEPIALFAAAWWLLHPLLSETVLYVTQRTESMMGLFLLLTVYASIRAGERGAGWWWRIVAVGACFAGMATKETMVVAPIVVVAYDLVFRDGEPAERVRGRVGLYAGLTAGWVLLAALVAGAGRTTAGLGAGVSPWTYALNQAEVVARYAWLTIWPRALVLDYGLPRALTASEVAAPALVVIVLLAATVVTAFRRPRLGFPLLCVWLTLAPTSSLLPIASEVGAERRMFLPLAALAPCVGMGVWWLSARAGRTAAWARVAVFAAAGLWLAGLGAATVARNAEYRDPLTLWSTSVARRPNGRARLSYAIDLIAVGRQDDAIAQLRDAVADYPRARYSLGTELSIKGDFDGAAEQLLAFLRDTPPNPSTIPARRLLGRVFISKGQPDASIQQFTSILAMAPKDADAHASLGDLYASMGRLQDAETEYRALIAVRDSNAEGYLRLGLVLIGGGRLEQAVPILERAAELDPTSPDPHVRLGEVFVQLRQFDQALAHAKTALSLAPSDTAHNVAGIALASQGQLGDAVEHFRAALALAPGNDRARENLARAERITGRGIR